MDTSDLIKALQTTCEEGAVYMWVKANILKGVGIKPSEGIQVSVTSRPTAPTAASGHEGEAYRDHKRLNGRGCTT